MAAAGSDGVCRRAGGDAVQGEGPDAVPGQVGGVHSGLWGEGDGEAL